MYYYLDCEVGFSPEDLEKYRRGDRFQLSPETCKLITLQFQPIDIQTGRPCGELTILKEWESSEKEIIEELSQLIDARKPWNFVPVGFNILFDIGLFAGRAKKYGIEYDPWFVYHSMPYIDLKPVCLGMNDFQFRGSGLDKFSSKQTAGDEVPVWYANKQYDRIVEYIENETNGFVELYAKLKRELPLFREERGFITKKSK